MKVYNMTIQLAKECRVKLNRETVHLHGRHETKFPTNSYMFVWVTLYDNVQIYHSNSQLTRWVGENKPVHVEKKINKWHNIIM